MTTAFSSTVRPRKSYDGQGTISPIEALPVELLSYIFVLSTLSDNVPDRQPLFTSATLKTAGVVCQVSKRWRGIALNTPSLWANICITIESVGGFALESEELIRREVDTRTLRLFLRLSRKSPLSILIDIRDPDWDFYEPGVPNSEFHGLFSPFTPKHMNIVMSLLLPHVHRWRSIDVLSDLWAPLHTAITAMSNTFLTQGAPMLESLTLMRCNEYASFMQEFQPQALQFPAFLDPLATSPSPKVVFPKLRNLCLWGVHANWSSLSHHLSKIPNRGLSSLTLADHCHEVLPSISEFYQLLSSSPCLNSLHISGSSPSSDGPQADTAEEDEEPLDAIRVTEYLGPVTLPELVELKLGYRTISEAMHTLSMIDAKETRNLEVRDGSDILDVFDVDAGRLLVYLGTGVVLKADEDANTPSPIHQQPFPNLEDVSLIQVKSCPAPFQTFFSSLKHLKRLELSKMGLQAAKAVFPQQDTNGAASQRRLSEEMESSAPSSRPSTPSLTHSGHTTPSRPSTPCIEPMPLPPALLPSVSACEALASYTPYPCPHLESLQIHELHHLQTSDMQYILNGIAMRQYYGLRELKDVDIHIDVFSAEEEGSVVVDVGVSGGDYDMEREGLGDFDLPLSGRDDCIMATPASSRRPSAMSVDEDFSSSPLLWGIHSEPLSPASSPVTPTTAKTRVRVTRSMRHPEFDLEDHNDDNGLDHEPDQEGSELDFSGSSPGLLSDDDDTRGVAENAHGHGHGGLVDPALGWVPGMEDSSDEQIQMDREQVRRLSQSLLEWVRSRRMWE